MKSLIVQLILAIAIFSILFGSFVYLIINGYPEPLSEYSMYVVLPAGLLLAYKGIKEDLKK